jgi:hypothetical protein
MKKLTLIALLLTSLVSCTKNYIIQYENGKMEEIQSSINYDFTVGDTVLIRSSRHYNEIIGKYVGVIPERLRFTSSYDSSYNYVDYYKVVIVK